MVTLETLIASITVGSPLQWESTGTKEEWDVWWVKLTKSPQDAFGLAAVLAQKTAAYASPQTTSTADSIENAAQSWPTTTKLNEINTTLWETREMASDKLPGKCRDAIMELMAISDTAYAIVRPDPAMIRRLAEIGSLSELDVCCVRIVPKYRTPQVGLTIRSWSHNLAAVISEVEVQYCKTALSVSKDPIHHVSLNVLLCPWPRQVRQLDFCGDLKKDNNLFGYFEYTPINMTNQELTDFSKIFKKASKDSAIDLVVFPECALSESSFDDIYEVVSRTSTALMAGIYGERKNQVRFRSEAHNHPINQSKHHRWKLDESQIYQYELGRRLAPHRSWWENIDVHDKKLMVLDTGDYSIVPLVCEDLARQEPIAPIIRSIGPSLVIALLLDGPQLETRWSAKYASVLSDDPGSSVLSFTSIGMVERSKPPPGVKPSRVIALWNSPDQKSVRPLELPVGADALVLTIKKRPWKELTADGRSNSAKGGVLYLAGYEPIVLDLNSQTGRFNHDLD